MTKKKMMNIERFKLSHYKNKREILIISLVIIAFAIGFCFVYDLWHTSQCSFGYIKGHFSDFYEYNTKLGLGTIVYYPTIYILYALWNWPIYVLGVDSVNIASPWILLYEKLFGYIFLAVMYFLIYRISQRVYQDKTRGFCAIFICFTIPIFFLYSIAWGLYDSVWVSLVLFGIYRLMNGTRKDDIIAIISFSIAASCKTLALFIILPVLFYRYKQIWQLFLSIAGTLAIMGIEIIAYRNSTIFNSTVLNPLGQFVDSLFGFSFDGVSFYLVALIIICIVAYRQTDNKNLLNYIWFPFASGTLFFVMQPATPQWLFIFMPYYAIMLTGMPLKERKLFYLLNICLTFACLGRVVGSWGGHYSEPTFAAGLFGKLVLNPSLFTSDAGFFLIKASDYFTNFIFKKEHYRYYVTIMAAVLFYAVYALSPWIKNKYHESNDMIIIGKSEKRYIYICFVCGIMLYFIPVILWVATHTRWG
jgi:hypothetical protein